MFKKSDIKDAYPLSPMQEGILFHYLMNQKNNAYHEQTIYRIRGQINLQWFEKAFNEIIQRYDVLRTVFIYKKVKKNLQVVFKKRKLGINFEDISHLHEGEKQKYIGEFKEKDKEKCFDLSKDILMRFSILRFSEKDYIIVWSHHHIIMDGWSAVILIKELITIYNSLKDGKSANLSVVTPYSSYIRWLEKQNKEQGIKYWRTYLEDYDNQIFLPTFKQGEENKNRYVQQKYQFVIDKSLTKELIGISNKNRSTINTTFQTIWGILLQRYNNTQDVVFGAVVSGRSSEIPGIEKGIGLFINTIPVRIKSQDGENFENLLEKVLNEMIASKAYDYIPLAEIQSNSKLKRDLLSHILVFENYPRNKEVESLNKTKDLEFSIDAVEVFEQTNYDLDILVVPTEELDVVLRYNSAVYDEMVMRRVEGHLIHIIRQIISQPGIRLSEIEILSKSEKRQLLDEFNDTEVEYPKDKTIYQLFEEQVERTPDYVALIGSRHQTKGIGNGVQMAISYKELNRESDRLAHFLQAKGIDSDTIVGIMAERSVEMIIGMLGILKAGGAYLPIEPGYPPERIRFIAADSNAKILLAPFHMTEHLSLEVEIIDICAACAACAAEWEERTEQYLTPANSPGNLAYVIYTSGSTGQPKGVMIEHRSLVNRLNWMERFYSIKETDVILQKTPIVFDVSVWELFWWSFRGASLCLLAPGCEKMPEAMIETIERNRVTTMHFVPSMLNVFLEYLESSSHLKQLASLRQVFSSGEALGLHHLEKFKQLLTETHHTRIINLYGPTEAAIDVSYFNCPENDHFKYFSIPIGKPIDNIHLYILDRETCLQPVGVPGELCIAGVGLARGYLNRPELTAGRFVEHLLIKGERIYKTGDLARWLPDGNIEFLGRMDYQVKIRGNRIELEEIEHCLSRHIGIKDKAVLAKEDKDGDHYLCAYIVPQINGVFDRTDSMEEKVRDYLSQTLPAYMLPSAIVKLEKMPLTPNGKLDRKSLPEPGGNLDKDGEYVAPGNELEQELVKIWQNVLNLKKVGIKDNFFNIGGDSIKIIRLTSLINDHFNTNFKIANLYANETIKKFTTKMFQDKLADKNDELKEVEQEIDALKQRIMTEHQPGNVQDIYPMSDIEEGMIFYSTKDPDSAVYHDQFVFQLQYHAFNFENFRKALILMTEKHPILRTGFNIEDFGEPVQLVFKRVDADAKIYDISNMDRTQQENYIKKVMVEDRKRPFNVAVPPLCRMIVFTRGNDRFCVLWVFHHAVLDGWSAASLVTELNNTYLKLKSDPDFVPCELKSTYKDFVIEQIAEKRKKNNIEYWKTELDAYKRLDFSGLKENAAGTAIKNYLYNLGNPLLDKLRNTANQYNSSIKNICFGIYIYILSMLSYDNDILVGLVTNNRPAIEDGEKILGCFLNTIPARMRIPSHITWSDYIAIIDKKMRELKEVEKLSLFEILRIIGEKSHGGNPLFDTLFNFVDFYVYDRVIRDEVRDDAVDRLSIAGYENTNTLMDFSVNMTGSQFTLVVSYSNTLISDKAVKTLCARFESIVKKIILDPGSVISKDIIITPEEKKKLLFDFNRTTNVSYPLGKTIHELFEEQVEKKPGDTALVYENKKLSYRELNSQSNRLARLIKESRGGIKPIVGLLLERSLEMVTAILGILKAGGAYLPIDPQYPGNRIEYMVKNSGLELLLTKKKITNIAASKVQTVDIGKKKIKQGNSSNLENRTLPSDPAYIIYTSGTTGNPKGVIIEHKNVVRLMFNDKFSFDFTANDVWTMFHSYCFDFSVWEMYGSLLYGGKLVIVPRMVARDPGKFLQLLKAHHVTVLNQTPSAFYTFLDEVLKAPEFELSLRYVIFGGEALTPTRLKNWGKRYPDVKLINMFGITETTVHVTVKEIRDKEIEDNKSNIGTPIPTLSVYVLDHDLKLLPIGAAGECCVGGEGVGRGYLNRPELTAEKFIENPYKPVEMLYKSGDLVRILSNGEMEYLGRIDHQVKIRGFRIELGEIEGRLLNHNPIKGAAVIDRQDNSENRYLCAYIAAGEKIDIPELRKYLSENLPPYMIPAYIMQVDKIPLTANGKLDRKALPVPEVGRADDFCPPGNPVEEKLARIWAEILRADINNISIDANFFELGGHSLNAVMLINKIHKELNVRIPLVEIFNLPTIRELSGFMKGLSRSVYAPIEPAEKKEYYQTTSAQKRMFLVDQIAMDTNYNMPRPVVLEGDVDKTKIERVFKQIIKRHSAFRTSFLLLGDNLVQRVQEPHDMLWGIEYDEADEAEARKFVTSHFIRRFDLSKAPLLRVVLIKVEASGYILIVDMHHIINDFLSEQIFVSDFSALYRGETLPGLKLQYEDYSEWQNSAAQKKSIKRQEEFWMKEFAGEIPVLNLPLDYPRPLVQSVEGETILFTIGNDKIRLLRKLVAREKATMYIVILTILNVLLMRVSGQNDILVGTALGGRRHVDLQDIFGMFVGTLVLRNTPQGEMTFIDFFNEVKERTSQAFENQEYEFDDLVQKLEIKRDVGRSPLFDVLFAFLGIDKKNDGIGETAFTDDFKILPFNDFTFDSTKFDLGFFCDDDGENMEFAFQYCTRIFKHQTIERFINYFKKILFVAFENPGIKLSQIEVIPEEERKQILLDFNNTKAKYPKDRTIHELFEIQAQRTPNQVGVIGPYLRPGVRGNGSLTYRELDERAGQFAHLLKGKGARGETIVAIMAKRSLEMIIGIMAVLKVGGAYLPIDLTYPEERIKYMMVDSGAKILVTTRDLSKEIQIEKEIIYLSDEINPTPRPNLLSFPPSHPSNLAYIIYTSGSTGQPKGVMVDHQNVVRLVKNTNFVDFQCGDRILQTGVLEFDASTFEIWGALLNGLTLYMAPKEKILNPQSLKGIIKNNQITTMWMTSPLFNQMVLNDVEIFSGLLNLLVGGDALSPLHINRLRGNFPRLNIINGYGPTENTTFSTTFSINREYNENIPIGKPIANSTAYIVDKNRYWQPIGIAGELWVGGDGVSRGYLNNPELTAERFVISHLSLVIGEPKSPQPPNDRCPMTNDRLYKTGDLARWLADGNIEFLGRIDQQVKIRGFRVELGEIESCLLRTSGIKEAVVSVREEVKGDKYICAYFVSNRENKVPELHENLSKKLPDYMIPAYFVRLDKIPLTLNGKIDREALPEPGPNIGQSYTAPRDEIETKLVELWAEILGNDVFNTTQLKMSIGIDDNFFQLGGHSLKATTLALKVHKEMNVKIPLVEIFRIPTIRELAAYIKGMTRDIYVSIQSVEEKEYYELSPAQKRLYILQQLVTDNTGYNMPYVIPLVQSVEKEELESVFKRLIERHDSLRTSFITANQKPVQRIHRHVDFSIDCYDIKTEVGADSLIPGFIEPFDLTKAPLLKVNLVKVGTSRRVLFVDMHHIITDGTSQDILEKEILRLKEEEELPPLRLQYKDYSQWQNKEEEKKNLKHQEDYWLKEFSGEIPVLELPTDFPRPVEQSFDGNKVNFEIIGEETRGLKALALTGSSTLFMVLTSIFNTLLYKLSGQEDIVIGTPIAGRRHPDLEKIIGMFVNTISLRNHPTGDRRFREFLGDVKERTLRAFENQEYPFEALVDKLSVKRDIGRNPLFDVMFDLQNMNILSADQNEEIEIENSRLFQTSKFDLSLTAVERGPGLFFSFEYCTKLFKRETIDRFIDYYRKIISIIVKAPDIKIWEIEVLSEEEKIRLLHDFNDTAREYPTDKTIHLMFEEQAVQFPDNTTLIFQDRKLTYRQLNRRSNQLSRVLKEKGVKEGSIVGILLDRCPEILVSILAILKSGGAYLPIDPQYPPERIKFMLKDANSMILLTQGNLFSNAAYRGDLIIVEDEEIYKNGYSNLALPITPREIAYIIYTSGSTGTPRGVMVAHFSVINLAFWQRERFNVKKEDRILQFSSISFDASVEQIIIAFCSGAGLVLIDRESLLDTKKFEEFVVRHAITHIDSVPSFLGLINIPKSSQLKRVTIGGEVCPLPLAKKWYKNCEFHNEYGPTETTVVSIQFQVGHWNESMVLLPIGKPLANTKVYILDRWEKLLPYKVTGELYIGGDGLAVGYLNSPEKTREKFIPNPFSLEKGRMYRTGDLCRWLPDGNIEFLGRIDHQVKIRGFRIEPGEIENRLLNVSGVKEAVVSVREEDIGDKYICAYIVSEREYGISELQEYLSKELPDYMIPAYFVRLEKIPLTPNGKVDSKALPGPEIATGKSYITPRGEVETKLAEIWSEVLEIEKEKIGIDTNFFESGGHSLKATILVSKIHKEFEVRVLLAEIFKAPRLEALARYIKERSKDMYMSIKSVEKKEYYPLSSAQKRLFILQQMQLGSTAYNMPELIPLEMDFDLTKIEDTFKKLIARHENFHTSFYMVKDKPVQRIHEEIEFKLEYYDASKDEIENISKGFVKAFDLSQAPLLRVGLLTSGEGNRMLMMDMHHIISDGVSHQVLVRDFMNFYDGEEPLPLRVQYKDFSQWQNSEKEKIKKQEKYWLKKFAGEIPVLELPTDFVRPAVQSFDGADVSFEIPEEESSSLKQFSLEQGVTLFMVLLGVVNVLLSKLGSQEDIIVGTPIAGRRHADLEKIIGMFVNTLALRNHIHGKNTFAELLKELKKRALEAFENQDYPFEDLVEKISVNRDTGRNPLFDVMFVLQNINEDKGEIQTTGLECEASPPGEKQYSYKPQTSKFDLTLNAVEYGGRIKFNVGYCTKLFRRETIEKFIRYFKKIVSAVISSPQEEIWKIDIMSEEEKEQLLCRFNHTRVEYPTDKNLHQLFQEQTAGTPGKIAVIFQDSQLTYNELNERSNRLAELLREKGVKSGTIVGILLDRSLAMIVSILAILKSGGTYVPLDTKYPAERIKYILKDSNAGILLSGKDLPGTLKSVHGDDLIILDVEEITGGVNLNPSMINRCNDVAYIIYTSGSTGTPRGVMIKHSSAVNLVLCQRRRFQINEGERILQFSSISFDASVEQIFISLSSGAALVLIGKEDLLDKKTFESFIARYCITHIHAVPSFLKTITLEQRYALKRVLAGGDICPISIARQWYQVCDFYNRYGPTETTITSIEILVEDLDSSMYQLPIGKPLDNTTVYILDHWEKLVPINVVGELYIGGEGVGRGYLNHVDLTAKKFKINPFSEGGRFYQTGDLCRWLGSGDIEFVGRIDYQVKIRGYRIELGEIENRLLKHGEIKEVVVSNREDKNGDKYLCAYIVCQKKFILSQLRASLSKVLPDYMIPSYFVPLEKIPLTPNGKIDRRALPAPEIKGEGKHTPPGTRLEVKLVEIWSDVLGIEKEVISTDANFFELGGHSLKATILAARIQKRLNVNIPLIEIFTSSTIHRQAQYIKNIEKEKFWLTDENIILLKRESPKAKHLFFIHDGSGEVEGYKEFCQHLDGMLALNCWGIRANRIKNYTPQNITIEEIAWEYIQKLKKIQSRGPYFIVGWSLGGTIAFEMTRLLEIMEEEVAFLALIDSPPPQDCFRRDVSIFTPETEKNFIKKYLGDKEIESKLQHATDTSDIWPLIVDYLESDHFDVEIIKKVIAEYEAHVVPNYHQLDIEELVRYLNVGRTFHNARGSYVPSETVNTSAHFFKASESKFNQRAWDDYFNRPLKFHEINGSHYSIMQTPHVTGFVTIFGRIIKEESLLLK